MTTIQATEETGTRLPTNETTHSSFAKTAFIGEILKGRRLAEFALGLGNAPGDLVKAAELFARHRVNILSGFHDAEKWAFFADFTDSDISPAEIADELKTLSQVSEIVFRESADGVLIDSLNYPFVWGKHRAIIIRAETISSIISRIWELFGKKGPVGAVILHTMGEAAGRSTARLATLELDSDAISKHLPAILDLYSSAGWGQVSAVSVDTDQGTAEIMAIDNFECSAHKGEDSQPFSHFLRGHLAGLFSELLGKRLDAEETHCIVQGAPNCLFKVAPVAQGGSK